MQSALRQGLVIPRDGFLATILATAMLSSAIVFSEPAPVDVLLAGFIFVMVLLGAGRVGPAAKLNLSLWLVIVAFSFLALARSIDFTGALIHQVVTLFLVFGAAAIAAFVAADPIPRARLVLSTYTAAVTIACLLAYIGYFDLLPGAYDLFTNYGRARGSFKDPNVFGAALAPAMVYLTWLVLRRPLHRARLPAFVLLAMAPAMLITFSRGAWISLAVSLAVLVFIGLTRTRRRSDHVRLCLYAIVGCATLALTIATVLQIPQVSDLMRERASLTQGYDIGPEGRFGGQMKAIQLILEHPFGLGTHVFRERHHHEEVHNVYLTMFHYGGWITGLCYIASVLLTFLLALRGALRIDALQGPFVVLAAAMAGLIVEGVVIDSDHWRHFFIIMGLIWGLSDAGTMPRQAFRQRSTDPDLPPAIRRPARMKRATAALGSSTVTRRGGPGRTAPGTA